MSAKASYQNTSFIILFKRSMYSPFIFKKTFTDLLALWVDVSDNITTPEAISVPMIRCFGVLTFLSQQVTCSKTICKENLV